jgi:hypothetical protein
MKLQRTLAAAFLFAASIGLAAGSAADTKTLQRAGSWEAFGGTTTKGLGVCGISAEPAGRYFGLKLYAGYETFTIQLGTSQWKSLIVEGEKLSLTLRFDNNAVWNATGTAFLFEDGDPGLQFHVNVSEINNFGREFRTSSKLVLQFDGNRVPQWVLGLEGTMQLYAAFQNCMDRLK